MASVPSGNGKEVDGRKNEIEPALDHVRGSPYMKLSLLVYLCLINHEIKPNSLPSYKINSPLADIHVYRESPAPI